MIQPVAVAGLDALARTALASGVGWITLDSALYLDNLRREFPDQLVALVTADNNQVGRLQARLFRALLPRGGSVVYVEGPSLAPATIHRRTGMQEGLAGSGIQISRTLTGDWTEVGAEKAVTFWLRLGTEKARPDVIAAQNDLMAVGARRAVQGLRPDWSSIPFTGCDGLPDGGQRLVRQRLLTATIVTPTTVGASIELAASFLEGKAVHPVTLLSPRTYPALEDLANANRG